MDADGNLSQTFVITEPGKYCLGENIAFAPVDEFAPAINILSNDVKLDLCSNTLTQANLTPNAYGVQIGEGYFYTDPNAVLKNITITNGSITNFSAIGVFCYNASLDFVPGALGLPFQSIIFTDLNILECGSSPSFDFGSGIDLDVNENLFPNFNDPAFPIAYRNVIINNCKVNRCLGNGANPLTFSMMW